MGALKKIHFCPIIQRHLFSHLQKAVSNQSYEQLVAIALAHQRGIFRGIHAREVKHGHVRLPIMINGKVQLGQLVIGGEVSCLSGIGQ